MQPLTNSSPTTTSYNRYETVEAETSDAQAICDIVNEAFKKDLFREVSRTNLEQISSFFDSDHTWYVIKVKENNITTIAGTVLYSNDQAPESSTHGNIHMLAVRAAYQGKGLSLHLLKAVENKALLDQKDRIALIVAEMNSSLCTFYQKQGYEFTGETFILPNFCVRPQYKMGDDHKANSSIAFLHMEKILKA